MGMLDTYDSLNKSGIITALFKVNHERVPFFSGLFLIKFPPQRIFFSSMCLCPLGYYFGWKFGNCNLTIKFGCINCGTYVNVLLSGEK